MAKPLEHKSALNGKTYYLHGVLSKNKATTLYFFANTVKDGVLDAVPEGREIVENSRTGMPILRRIQ